MVYIEAQSFPGSLLERVLEKNLKSVRKTYLAFLISTYYFKQDNYITKVVIQTILFAHLY